MRKGVHRRRWVWPLAVAGSGAVCLLVGVSTVREGYSQWKVDQEIGRMQSEVETLEGKKLALADLIQRLDSPEALDKEARTRLGLRKPGERVIILRGMGEAGSWQDASPNGTPSSAEVTSDDRTNPRRWFDYFIPHP